MSVITLPAVVLLGAAGAALLTTSTALGFAGY